MGGVISEVVNAEWIDIVDDKNKVIAQATRQQMRIENLFHRAAYIIVHDGMGKILIQRCTEMKDIYPGLFDATAVGVVTSGEGMLAAARREAEEELEIADIPFAEHGLFYYEITQCRVWGGLFSCVSHVPFALQETEVESVFELTPDEINARRHEFTPSFTESLVALFHPQ
ncbi:putative Nudix hydrolase YfcD [Arsenophonus endosymbiont of Aleurodicus floccissimus]|nr:putative Nudix hydrolase YfcD [Arsenophonus endosymbiont of Aleurodicus floccissimus]